MLRLMIIKVGTGSGPASRPRGPLSTSGLSNNSSLTIFQYMSLVSTFIFFACLFGAIVTAWVIAIFVWFWENPGDPAPQNLPARPELLDRSER